MDKITHIALLPPDKFSKRLKDAGLKETEELIATECTLYTPTVDGLRRLVQTVGEQTRSDKITVEVGDHDVTIPLVPGKEIQVTRDGIPDQRARGSAGSPSPSAHTDREEPAESVYSRLERAGARAAIGSGAIPKHANFITGFSPANWEEETWGEKNSVFKPRQTSTEKKDKYGKLVQEDSSDSSSTCYSEDEMLPKRKKVNYKRSKSLSRERRSSSGQREHENLGGRTFLTCPGLVLDSQDPQWSALTEVQQKVVRLAVGPTSDEILDMPGTSFKAKIDMLAEQLDCMQKSLCYLLLDGHKPAKREPTVNDVRKMRETTYREPESNRDKNKSKKEKAQQRDGSAKIVARESFEKSRGRETHRQVVKYEEESSNSQSEYDYLTSDTEGDCGGEEKVFPLKQGVDLSLTAALARQKREKRKSDRKEEDVSLKPRRGPPRQAKGDRVSAIQLLQNMRFQGAKDSMQKARMIAALGKTLNASTALIEQMIRHHTGISLKLQIIESHYDHATSAVVVNSLKEWIKYRGKPERVRGDNAHNLTGSEVETFCKENGIALVKAVKYQAASNGIAERAVRSAKEFFVKNQGLGDWDSIVNLCAHYLNYRVDKPNQKPEPPDTSKNPFKLGVKCPAEGVIVVCKDLSDSFLVKTWHKDCREGTPSVRRKPIDCVFCSKQDVCSLLWEGPREIRESQAWLRAQLTILPKWFSTDRSIGACAVGDVTVCGSCRTQRQLWSIWQYELAVGTCGCNTCTDCRLKYNLRGQECKCTLNDLGELAKCERCKLMLKKRWLKVTSFKGVWQTRKSETSLGCLAKDKIMAEWEVNPLALISNTEKAFLWERLLCSGGPVPRDSDPLVKGGVLDVTLARDSDLDLWKEVIRDPVYEKGHPKQDGETAETSEEEVPKAAEEAKQLGNRAVVSADYAGSSIVNIGSGIISR
ncbi:hypothetical protein F2P79_025764 [Pimephales promelas]|nr:hypothetical protein F2P79_025764 [Pimephales promelas]